MGSTVLEASVKAGVLIAAPCGGRGVCGACGVRVVEGALAEPDESEMRGLARAPEGVRLACRARVVADVVVRPLVVPRVIEAPAADSARQAPLVAAVDLGTTTVSAAVFDAGTGRELARGVTANRQQPYGTDVLSRISSALEGASEALRFAAEGSVLDALEQACAGAGVDAARIGALAVAGNSAMTGLLLGADVESLATHPFEPPVRGVKRLSDSCVTRALASDARTVVLPPIAAFVGGDTTAALIATDMFESREPALLVDLGTNAEVALAGDKGLWVASAAAGPAFEAAGIGCGGPATDGGVVSLRLAGDTLDLDVVGGGEPLWLTGSGLISAVVMLRRAGHLRADGLLLVDGPLRSRFSHDAEGVLGIDLGDRDVDPASCLRLDQRDVRAFQLAKAAVWVAVTQVLETSSVRSRAVERVLVAGAFGAALDPADIVELGVLPRKLGAQVRAVGDAALQGAGRVALRPSLAISAATWVAQAHHVDLAADPHFNDQLMAALALEPM